MNRLARIFLLFFAVCVFFSTADVAHPQLGRPEGLYYKSWAVIFGINDYLLAPKLTTPVPDGKAVAEALRKLGFEEVIEIYDKDASFKGMQHVLTEVLPRKVGRHDRVLIFFAGHAGSAQDRNGQDLGYLVPWDAQANNASKGVTLDQLKEFSRRVMSKHVLFILAAGASGWDITAPQQLSLEGRTSPEEETDKRAVQVLTAAKKGETPLPKDKHSVFTQTLLAGLTGAADQNKNGWLMASELGAYVTRQVPQATGDKQHPQYARLDGDGDMIIIEGKKGTFQAGEEPKTDAERIAAAKDLYDRAFATLQQQRPPQEALNSLNKALEYNPSYGEAYILKSYILLEYFSNLDDALAASQKAVKLTPQNADSHFTLGLILKAKQRFKEAEQAMRQAAVVDPTNADILLALADLYAEDLKDQKKAAMTYKKYLDAGGTDPRAKEYLDKAAKQ